MCLWFAFQFTLELIVVYIRDARTNRKKPPDVMHTAWGADCAQANIWLITNSSNEKYFKF